MKKLTLFMMTMLLAFSLSACGGGDEETNVPDTQEEIVQNETIDREASELNLLTGEDTLSEEAVGKRPIAVMVNNIAPSFPQYGIAQADIIFEMPVEGNQTRFMALFGDYTQVPKVCSVRSARKYFPAMAEGFDAVYVNWGMAEAIRPYINSLNLTHYDGASDTNGLFARDNERKAAGFALEHTGYFDGTKIDEVLEANKQRTDIEEGKESTAFLFNTSAVKPNGKECTSVTVEFGAATASFTYDAESATYLKSHNGKAQMDGKTNTQLAFTNLIILETYVGPDPNGTHKAINWYEGTGYYVSNGAMQEISFSKAGEQERLVLYDEDGNELAINPGKSYISMNSVDSATLK